MNPEPKAATSSFSTQTNCTTQTDQQELSSVVNHAITDYNKQVLLSTAIVKVQDSQGNIHTCRLLLDSGSQSNFITRDLVEKLRLNKTPINISITGIGKLATNFTYKTEVKFSSIYNNYNASVSCIVVPQITGRIPSYTFNISELDIPNNINLADNTLNTSDKVDLLIGCEVFYQILCAGQVLHNNVVFQKTRLGWVVGGFLNGLCSKGQNQISCHATGNDQNNQDLQDQLAKFWHLEECSSKIVLSREELSCEEHFTSTTTRNIDGRFIVTLPLKETPTNLGNSEDIAINRFYSLERKLSKNFELKQQYIAFMREYEKLGHMTEVTESENANLRYYLPHHAVIKEDSATTKLRVVFDGSAKTNSGVSLNDIQIVGPVLQDDLFSILIRFRKHRFVVAADIAKMYRQVLINPEQRNLQRIVWRENPYEPLRHFSLNTVTYGTASASFLSIRCLQQLAHEHSTEYSRSSKIILRDFWVDDLLTGADTVDEIITLREEITAILKTGCFDLRKWISNNPAVVKGIQNMSNLSVLELGPRENTKTLGLIWYPTADSIGYNININAKVTIVTKRQILSSISKIFDPLGLLGPCIIIPKIILQKLWQYNLTWDESLPLDLHTQWLRFQNELNSLSEIHIPRCTLLPNPTSVQLHGFSDASEAAYGACLYIRSADSIGNVCVNLLCAKSKVAPLKRLSIPRLELCGALLLSKLAFKVQSAIDLNFESKHLWCDSTVAIAWIRTSPNLLKQFVSNRVDEIQELTDRYNWRYVASGDNPADLLSRGINPRLLQNSSLWWSGPSWLSNSVDNWPGLVSEESRYSPQYCNEVRHETTTLVSVNQEFDIFNKHSSLLKLQRCVAYCLRFKDNCLASKRSRRTDSLSVDELNNSLKTLIQIVQRETFREEIQNLRDNKIIGPKSKLIALAPFLDESGILRVGGRLRYSNFPLDKKHPCVLPKDHKLTFLIMRHEHLKNLHCGPQALLASVRETFWPISGRNIAKKVVRECVICFRSNPPSIFPLMGSLPKDRVSITFPFIVTGVDYCGPIVIKNRLGRGSKSIKAYICIFICLSIKAIHLELVSDLTTEAFIAALRRFTARRGKPSKIRGAFIK